MSGIRLENVSKQFPGFTALQPTNLAVEEGEFLVFVGPSGCGKSTCLRLIAGLEDVSSGKIYLGERDVTWLEPKHRQVAMVFQNYALYPHFTVQGNLEYPLNIMGLSKIDKAKRVAQVADLLEIGPLLGRRPSQLSGGQRQRVAIGRALVRDPQVFLFDEPLSNLDARLREQMRLELARLQAQVKKTSIYVTHDQHEAMTLGDRLAVMRQGHILEVGAPLELYRNPQCLFTAQFLGQPTINQWLGRVEGGNFTAPGLACPAPLNQGEGITLAIRPEDLQVTAPGGLRLETHIERVETLGRETHLTLNASGVSLQWVTTRTDFKSGQALQLVARPT